MVLKETEAKDDCAGEGQYQFSRPTDRLSNQAVAIMN
jgi:hypothetical protein